MRLPLTLLSLALALIAIAPGVAQISDSRLTLAGNNVSITFSAPDGTPAGNFVLQRSDELTEESWEADPGAIFSPVGVARFNVATTRPSNERRAFYRIILDDVVITAEFTALPLSLIEGGASSYPISFSSPFTGTITYTALLASGEGITDTITLTNAMSTDIVLSGQDDADVQGERYATLSITLSDQVGTLQGRITIKDNDEIWDGLLLPESGGQLAFCLRRLRSGGSDTLTLVSPPGASFLPPGSGPPISNPVFTTNLIQTTLESSTLPASESPFGAPYRYRITLSANARPGFNGTLFDGAELTSASLERIVGAPPNAFEPNGTTGTATDLREFAPAGEVIEYAAIDSGADIDIYRITGSGSTSPRIRILFSHATGDLDMRLLDENGTPIETSDSVSDVENIDTSLSDGQVRYIQVYGFSGATGPYRLVVGDGVSVPAPDASHLTSTQKARFMLTKRPLPAEDRKAALTDTP